MSLTLAAAANGSAPSWPPFLGPRADFAPDVVAAVERVWTEPTLSRVVRGPTVRVPFAAYLPFVDVPEVTAAAARRLKLARYEVEVFADDLYRADDGEGARGVYRVLGREAGRRVILSWGEHTGSVLGRIRGSALTVLDLEPAEGGVAQRISAHVRIENRLTAGLARVLVAIFGHVADRKLAEGSLVSGRVAEWAVGQAAEFCEWLGGEKIAPERRARFVQAVGGCP